MRLKREDRPSLNARLGGGECHAWFETRKLGSLFYQSRDCKCSGRAALLSRRNQTSQLREFSFGLNNMANMTTCLDVPFVKLHPLLRQQS